MTNPIIFTIAFADGGWLILRDGQHAATCFTYVEALRGAAAALNSEREAGREVALIDESEVSDDENLADAFG